MKILFNLGVLCCKRTESQGKGNKPQPSLKVNHQLPMVWLYSKEKSVTMGSRVGI